MNARKPWIIRLAIILHITWGVLALYSPDALNCSALHALNIVFQYVGGRYVLGLFLIAVGFAAEYGLARHVLWWVLPQQIVMIFTAAAAGVCIANSQFADGVVRPWPFIAADQSPQIIFSLLHTAAVLDVWAGDLIRQWVGRWRWRH